MLESGIRGPVIKSLCVALLCLAFRAECAGAEAKETSAPKPIIIGAALGLSGEIAAWGGAELNGATLALQEINASSGINGRRLELLVEDTFGSSMGTVNAVSRLINFQGIHWLLGPTWADSFEGAVPLIEQARVFAITPSASATIVNREGKLRHLFSTYHRSDHQAQQLALYLEQGGVRSVVQVFDADPWWEDIRSHFERESTYRKISVKHVFRFNLGVQDFSAAVARLKKLAPDAIVFGFSDASALLSFLKEVRRSGLRAPMYTTESVANYLPRDEFASLLVGVKFVAPVVSDLRFAEKYRNRFGSDPVFSAANAYDAINILARALKAGHGDPDSVRNYLLSNTFETVSFGSVSFDSSGGVTSGLFSLREISSKGIINSALAKNVGAS